MIDLDFEKVNTANKGLAKLLQDKQDLIKTDL
jgi:hypothetical protein